MDLTRFRELKGVTSAESINQNLYPAGECVFSSGDTKLQKKFSWRGIGERIYRTEHCEGPNDEQCI